MKFGNTMKRATFVLATLLLAASLQGCLEKGETGKAGSADPKEPVRLSGLATRPADAATARA